MSDGRLRALFASHLPDAHWQAVETFSTGQGVPDAEYCFPGGISGWVECKATHSWQVDFRGRAHQLAWLERRVRVGGRAFLAVRRTAAAGPRRGAAADELWLFSGGDVRAVRAGGLLAATSLALARLSGGPARWAWDEVRRVLTS